MAFKIVITGRKAPVVLTDPLTKKMRLGEDSSPQVMTYRDEEHAVLEASRLHGLLEQNAGACVELRPDWLAKDADGVKMTLEQWLAMAKVVKGKVRPQRSLAPKTPVPNEVADIESLLAGAAHESTSAAPH